MKTTKYYLPDSCFITEIHTHAPGSRRPMRWLARLDRDGIHSPSNDSFVFSERLLSGYFQSYFLFFSSGMLAW
jgi:hypothetical protein